MPRISVCIATYNGENYIRDQIESIRSQLSEQDEIIISDDSSSDGTVKIIKDFHDSRIRLLQNQKFQNPTYNFENCICHATGDIIFISDQDDLWLPHKVSIVLAVFQNNRDITLVASDAQVINGQDEIVVDSFYGGKLQFSSEVISNIVRNRFLGCTLAFRKSILDVILPFPRRLPMHDIWIGIMNQMYGKVYFVDAPLISYRRHSQNFTSSTRSGLIQILLWRLMLIVAISGRILKCGTRKLVV